MSATTTVKDFGISTHGKLSTNVVYPRQQINIGTNGGGATTTASLPNSVLATSKLIIAIVIDLAATAITLSNVSDSHGDTLTLLSNKTIAAGLICAMYEDATPFAGLHTITVTLSNTFAGGDITVIEIAAVDANNNSKTITRATSQGQSNSLTSIAFSPVFSYKTGNLVIIALVVNGTGGNVINAFPGSEDVVVPAWMVIGGTNLSTQVVFGYTMPNTGSDAFTAGCSVTAEGIAMVGVVYSA